MLKINRNARTRELLKVFNIEGQIENRVDMPSSQEQAVEDEMNVKFVSKAKKDKPQGFLQRSRNALIGAADAVRRVAKGAGALVEDTKKTEAMVLAADGIIWTACNNGLLIHWDGNGNRLQDFTRHPATIQSICAHGSRIWVGYVTGNIQALDLEGNLVAGWVAHNELSHSWWHTSMEHIVPCSHRQRDEARAVRESRLLYEAGESEYFNWHVECWSRTSDSNCSYVVVRFCSFGY